MEGKKKMTVQNNGVIALQLGQLKDQVSKHDRLILGNGQPGLVQRVAEMDAAVDNIEKSSMRIAKVAESLSESVTKVHQESRAASKTINAVNKKIKTLERIVGPMVDWKKNIYIRLSAILGTLSAVGTAAGFILYYFDKIKTLFGP